MSITWKTRLHIESCPHLLRTLSTCLSIAQKVYAQTIDQGSNVSPSDYTYICDYRYVTYTYMWLYTCIYTCIHAWPYTVISLYIQYAYTVISLYIQYAYIYIYVWTHIYIVHIHIHIYIYKYTYMVIWLYIYVIIDKWPHRNDVFFPGNLGWVVGTTHLGPQVFLKRRGTNMLPQPARHMGIWDDSRNKHGDLNIFTRTDIQKYES